MSTKKKDVKDTQSATAGTVIRVLAGLDIVPVEDVASELNVTTHYVRQLCYRKRLGSCLFKRFLITRQELDEFKKVRRPVGRPPS